MDIKIGFLMAAGILIVSEISASVLLLAGDFKYYKRIYKTLPGRTFYRNRDQVYSHSFGEEDDGFVWFSSTGDFRLVDGRFLTTMFYTYLSPYSGYWLWKYKRWFRENVNIEKIEKY